MNIKTLNDIIDIISLDENITTVVNTLHEAITTYTIKLVINTHPTGCSYLITCISKNDSVRYDDIIEFDTLTGNVLVYLHENIAKMDDERLNSHLNS